jgi:hypothetical protein
LIIHNLYDLKNKTLFLPKDENDRIINIYSLNDCCFVGDNLYYPNCLVYSYKENKLFNPLEEKIMSLKDVENKTTFSFTKKNLVEVTDTVFYFVYNTDNYYHFLYDSLPYLYTFLHLKKEIKDLKLLMNYPNSFKKENYKFVNEILNLLDIDVKDIIFLDDGAKYKKVLFSSSYTHGIDSNLPPRNEIYQIYDLLKNKIRNNTDKTPEKIYISRRSWIHNDFSNIGTNYTTKRRMVNEDELVEQLKIEGFKEIFTENLSTIEKINLFINAEYVVGSIGGGMCNLLFCEKLKKAVTICSPEFLNINKRFLFSINHKNNILYTDTNHFSDKMYKKYMRIKTKDGIVGEICDIHDKFLTIEYSNTKISGWNLQQKFEKINVLKEDVTLLDNGLNSEWVCNIQGVLKQLKC